MKKLISIIVPVYNVEEYVGMCIESVCNQTYRNLEIILVDDGSTDRSGDICDAYARRDERIRVIHKENGGLSDARNAGMAIASGEYTGFVDSDDWIETDMYEILYKICEKEDLDMACCAYQREEDTTDGSSTDSDDTNCDYAIMNSDDFLKANLYANTEFMISNCVWNRLYKTTLIEGLLFPKGKCYEDMCYSTEVFLRLKRGGYIKKKLYHYRIRKNSITGKRLSSDLADNVITDLLPLLKTRAEILSDAGKHEFADECTFQYLYEILKILSQIHGKAERKNDYRRLKQEIRKYRNWINKYAKSTASAQKKRIALGGGYFTDIYVCLRAIKYGN